MRQMGSLAKTKRRDKFDSCLCMHTDFQERNKEYSKVCTAHSVVLFAS